MDEQIERIEQEIEAMGTRKRFHEDNLIAFENAIAMAQRIVEMLRDGTPLPNEQEHDND